VAVMLPISAVASLRFESPGEVTHGVTPVVDLLHTGSYKILSNVFVTSLCSRLSSSTVRFYTKNGRFAVFELHLGVRSNVRYYLMLIGKHVLDFLLVLIELSC